MLAMHTRQWQLQFAAGQIPHFDDTIGSTGDKPFIARLDGDTTHPAQMARNDAIQFPRCVPFWLWYCRCFLRYQLYLARCVLLVVGRCDFTDCSILIGRRCWFVWNECACVSFIDNLSIACLASVYADTGCNFLLFYHCILFHLVIDMAIRTFCFNGLFYAVPTGKKNTLITKLITRMHFYRLLAVNTHSSSSTGGKYDWLATNMSCDRFSERNTSVCTECFCTSSILQYCLFLCCLT